MGRPAALVDPDWHEQAVQAIQNLAKSQEFVTSDDLRKVMDEPENANRYGAAFRSARARKIIVPVDYGTSTSRSRNGGSRYVWTLHPSQKDKE